MSNEVLATLRAAPARRYFAYGALLALGALMVYVAFVSAPSFGFRVMLIVFGAGILVMAERMRRATGMELRLLADGIYDSSGTLVVAVDDIAKLDRGMFALKPSHGFVVTTKTKQPRAWAPGLWWRMGRRIGIGGVTPAGPAKFMAERLSMIMSGHDLDM